MLEVEGIKTEGTLEEDLVTCVKDDVESLGLSPKGCTVYE